MRRVFSYGGAFDFSCLNASELRPYVLPGRVGLSLPGNNEPDHINVEIWRDPTFGPPEIHTPIVNVTASDLRALADHLDTIATLRTLAESPNA